MTMQQKNKLVLFVGNSINRLSSEKDEMSWGNIIKRFEDSVARESGESDQLLIGDSGMPFVFRAERVFNRMKEYGEKFEDEWNNVLKNISEMEPSSVHKILASIITQYYGEVVTTNYDYTIEKALDIAIDENNVLDGYKKNVRRRHGNVWHIHGEAKNKDSILLSAQYYRNAMLSKRVEKKENTWPYLFFNYDIVICGFAADYHEALFWDIIARWSYDKTKKNKIYAFLFATGKNYKEEKACASLLESYGVSVGIINVGNVEKKEDCLNSDWENAWFTLLGKLIAIPNNVFNLNSVSQFVKNKALPDFNLYSKGYNVVKSWKTVPHNLEMCWMNIGVDKLAKCEQKNLFYIFDVKIDGEQHSYKKESTKIFKAFKEKNVYIIENSTPRYSFYLDFRRGRIYSGSTIDESKFVIDLIRIQDGDDYESLLHKL